MDRKQLVAIADTVRSGWNLDVGDLKLMYRTWWRYLHDLEFEAVLATVDQSITSGEKWPPKVGELRRRSIDAGRAHWPSAEQAWVLVEGRLAAANTGLPTPTSDDPEIDMTVGTAMRTAKTQDGFQKVSFVQAWNEATKERDFRVYGLPGDAPGVEAE